MTNDRPLRIRCGAALLSLFLLIGGVTACSSGGDEGGSPPSRGPDGGSSQDRPDGGSGSGARGAGGSSTTTAPGSGRLISTRLPARGIETPVQNVYYWKGDDNGDQPGDGSHMYLMFEPNGSADLMVENDSDQLTVGGSWDYADGEMSLSFDDENLVTEVSFEVDLDAAEITMPFRLLSGGEEGESTWIRSTSDPQTYLASIFLVATGGTDQASGPEAVERAVDYANAVIEANGEVPSGLRSTSASSAQGDSTFGDPGRISGVEVVKNPDGTVNDRQVRVFWTDGPPTTTLLWTWATPGTDNISLSQAPLAGDPRTHLPTKPSGNTSGDPATKRAVFIEPLNSFKSFTFNTLTGPALEAAAGFDWSAMSDALEDRGYSVTEVEDKEAGVIGTTRAILDGGDPGVLIINTHGAADGSIMVLDLILDPEQTTAYNAGVADSEKPGDAARAKLQKAVIDAGYRDLLNYTNANGDRALSLMTVHVTGKDPYATYVALTPAYWDWLREKKGVDLSRSLVYMAACDLDQSDLRDHVRAGSFWAFDKEIPPRTAGAIAQYLVKSIAKPTWTAEEAFYNLVRVVNTKEATYQHDLVLDGMVPANHVSGGSPSPLFDPNQTPLDKGFILNAYSMNGSTAVPYAGHGWLDPTTVSGSQIWWMTWAARWGQDAIAGAGNLDQCWNQFWSRGTNGGLASPFCNAANAGSTPTRPEVEHAKWLLTGNAPPADAPTRWTLNEGT